MKVCAQWWAEENCIFDGLLAEGGGIFYGLLAMVSKLVGGIRLRS